MAADEKSYPPSELKLTRLRRAGVIPLSRDVLTFGAFGGMVLAVSLLLSTAAPDLAVWAQSSFSASSAEAAEVRSFAGRLVLYGALLAGVSAACVIAAGLLQTRFLLSFGALRVDFGRLVQNPFPGVDRVQAALLAVLRGALWAAAAAVILAAAWEGAVIALLPQLGEVGGAAPEEASRSFAAVGASARESLLAALRWLVAITFFVALFSYILAVLRFRQAHKMSRAELEAELREDEPAAELKQLRAELRRDIGD